MVSQNVGTVAREKAKDVAERCVGKLFDGRKGHGGGPCSYRDMHREELLELFEVLFVSGFNYSIQITP